jgi:hypothetical protein
MKVEISTLNKKISKLYILSKTLIESILVQHFNLKQF